MATTEKKLILVIGATGAQGLVVINALLAPTADGAPSPYRVRALTRDPNNSRAKELEARGVELAVGMFFMIIRLIAGYDPDHSLSNRTL
jgi:uncharacterized protein YbjT (DUF2867 family)